MKSQNRFRWSRKTFFNVLICLGLLPFIFRIGLDTHEAVKQPVLEIYREWRWGPETREWRSGKPIIFERKTERDPFETMFMIQLQKDFRVQPDGKDLPRVRAYFDSTGRALLGRVEVLPVGAEERIVFQSKSRFPNNGILFGLWLGVLFFILGVELRTAVWLAALGTVLWAAEWNILGVPELFYNYVLSVFKELSLRFKFNDWTSGDLGRLPDLAILIWLPLGLVFSFTNKLRKTKSLLSEFYLFLASLLLEPLMLWTASIFGKWPAETQWWKIYLGSWGYRFFSLSFLFFLLVNPQNIKKVFRGDYFKRDNLQFTSWYLLLPVCFVMTGGWDWLGTVFFDGIPEPILKMKSFLIGGLVGALLGSRFFAIWIVTMSLAVLHPPSRGHWSAAANYGLLWEGIALGWWMSPLKAFNPREFLDLNPQPVKYLLIALCWILGVFLNSVGVPLALSWLILVLALWAVLALRSGQSLNVSDANTVSE